MNDEKSDPTKGAEFNRVVDHFLTTPKPHKPTARKPKERQASKGHGRKGTSK